MPRQEISFPHIAVAVICVAMLLAFTAGMAAQITHDEGMTGAQCKKQGGIWLRSDRICVKAEIVQEVRK